MDTSYETRFGGGLFGSIRRHFQSFVNATIENTARPIVNWLLHLEIAYLIAAGVAVIAAAFLLSAAASGLVEAGLPVWASQLILGAVAAILAFLLFKRASAKKLSDEVRDADDADHNGVTIRIGRTRVIRAPARRSTATFDVHRSDRDDAWEVSADARPLKQSFRTKRKAVSTARRRAARSSHAQVVIHKADGSIQRGRRSGSA